MRSSILAVVFVGLAMPAAVGRQVDGENAAVMQSPGFVAGVLRSTRKLAGPPAPLTPIDDLLAKPVDLSFRVASLRDLAAGIEQAVDCDVWFDRRALEEAGFDLDDAIVTAESHGIPLAHFLTRTLQDCDLDWTVADGGIEITTREAAFESLCTHIYDVSDLCDGAAGLQTLIAVVSGAIAPHTWEQCGGDGAIAMDLTDDAASLVVQQTLAVQRRVAGFLDGLRRLESEPAGERQTRSAEGYWCDSERTVAIRTALARPAKGRVEFAEASLRDVADSLTEASGVPIVLDVRSVDDAGIDIDEPRISFEGRSLPLGRLLDRILRDVSMAFVVEGDQIVITTADAASERFSVAIYPVDRHIAKGRDMERIAAMLQSNVTPDMWEEMGGPAYLRAVDGDAPCLVVSHTTGGHRAVAGFLGSLK